VGNFGLPSLLPDLKEYNSIETIEIPKGADVKYYKNTEQFHELARAYSTSGLQYGIFREKITQLLVLVVETTKGPLFFVHTKADLSPVKHEVIKFVPPRHYAELVSDTSISFEKQFVNHGETVKIRIYLAKPMIRVNLRVYKTNPESCYHEIKIPQKLLEGETIAVWDANVGDQIGKYGIMLTGVEDDGSFFHRTKIIRSMMAVEVVSDVAIKIGSFKKDGKNDFPVFTSEILVEEKYRDDLTKKASIRSLVMKAIKIMDKSSCVIMNLMDSGPGNSGTLRLMSINLPLTLANFNSKGILMMKPPTLQEFDMMRVLNMSIDRLITSDFIQVTLQGKYIISRLLGRDAELGLTEFKMFKELGKIKKIPFLKNKIKSIYEGAFLTPATLSNYLKLRDELKKENFMIYEGNYEGEVSIRVYPRSSRERVAWITFSETGEGDRDNVVLDKIKNAKKEQMRIIAPLLTSAAIVKQSGSFDIYVDIPNSVLNKGGKNVAAIIEDGVKIYSPVDKLQPFLNNIDSKAPIYSLKVNSKKLKLLKKNDPNEKVDLRRLYQGTVNRLEEADKVKETDIIRNKNEHEHYLIPYSAVLTYIFKRPFPVFNPEYTPESEYRFSLGSYYRKYPGLLDECENLYRVNVKFAGHIPEGMYLLKVAGAEDEKVHPLRVFEDGKGKYSFCHITDLHLARRYDDVEHYISKDAQEKYANPNRFPEKYAKDMNNADFVVITGDLIEYANDHRPYELDFIRDENWMYAEHIIRNNFSVPVYITLGNHDYRHNTVSLDSMLSDLELTPEEASKYPRDKLQDAVKWGMNKCLEDSLYCDENALQYYFYNFCPFYDYCFKLDELSFIFLDTKHDKFAFMNDYPLKDIDMTIEYAAQIKLVHNNPAPMSTGFLERQLAFLDSCLDKTGILFTHSALVNTPSSIPDPIVHPEILSKLHGWKREYIPEKDLDEDILEKNIAVAKAEIEDREHYLTMIYASKLKTVANERVKKLEEQIAELKKNYNLYKAIRDGGIYLNKEMYLGGNKKTYFDESSVIDYRNEIIKRMKSNEVNKKRIKLSVAGHVHKNLEFRLRAPDGEPGQLRWYCGEYASKENESKPFQDGQYAVTTVSTGYLGYRWVNKADKKYDDKDMDGYKKDFYGTGIRKICITKEGVIESMYIIEKR
jgi:hypothetical protein